MHLIRIALLTLLGTSAFAHPVAFQGAIGVMAYHQPDMVDWQVTYSATSRLGLGVDFYRDAMEATPKDYFIPRINFLMFRSNGRDHQANIYLSGGYGLVNTSAIVKGSAFGAVEADYETRRVYVSGRASTLLSSGLSDSTYYQFRAGAAPYLGDFDGLNSWIIVQSQYFPNALTEKVRVGPVLRFFYKNILWETGVTSQGTWSFNFMVHF